MRHSCQRRASCVAVLLGLLAFESIVASCAESEAEGGDSEDSGPANSNVIDAADAGCEGHACAEMKEDACKDVEWCPVNTNRPAGAGLSGVWGSGANDVWAVGGAGTVIHWDGRTWTSASAGTNQSLYAVWGSGPNDVWTVSSPSLIFHTTGFEGGTAKWSPVVPVWDGGAGFVSSTMRAMRTIWGTSPDDVWISGDSRLRRSFSSPVESGWRSVVIDGGPAWASVIPFANEIKSIWGSGPDDVWLVGARGSRSFVAHTNGVPVDGGVPTWTELEAQTISILHAVWGSGPSDVWTVGDYGTIRHWSLGTNMWDVVESPTTEDLRGLWGVGPNDIWAVGEHGTILHYDGTSWRDSTAAFPPGEKPSLYGVWGSGPSDVWAVGSVVMHFSGPKPGVQGATE